MLLCYLSAVVIVLIGLNSTRLLVVTVCVLVVVIYELMFSFWVGKRRYNIRLWKTFTDCFNCLPVAAILDEKIFCCHGGEC